MQNLSEFISRTVGITLFLSALAITVICSNALDSTIASVKQNYANDTVYSEASLEISDESSISREELMATLMRSPQRNVIVRDEVSDYVLTITAGAGTDTILTVRKEDVVDSGDESRTVRFGKDRWDLDKIDLDLYLQARTYRMRNITFSNGEIKTVLFYGE